jgi:hypothetical protein
MGAHKGLLEVLHASFAENFISLNFLDIFSSAQTALSNCMSKDLRAE